MTANANASRPFSFTSSEFVENPYSFYDKLRSIEPICRGNFFKYQGWYITGYEEARAVLKDARFKNRPPLPEASKKYETLKSVQNDMMLFKNQPDHKRLRLMVSQVFTPKMAESYRPFIKEAANELLDHVQKQKSMDVVSDFAFPLASLVIAQILGIPVEERHQFKEWTAAFIQTIDFTRSRKVLTDGSETAIKAMEYFNNLIELRKENLKDDLISKLIQEEQKGNKLSQDELLATCLLLVIAGHETTVNLISSSVLLLLQHPDQMQKLKDHPQMMEIAVEEFLRYEPPAQITARVASENIKVGETTIEKGEQVYILLGAANRDPKIFPNAHMLDITRNPNPHLSFGHGPHVCLGSALARIEAQIAIQVLLQRMPHIQLADGDPHYRKWAGIRSLEALPVVF